jgi:hypothetical protein
MNHKKCGLDNLSNTSLLGGGSSPETPETLTDKAIRCLQSSTDIALPGNPIGKQDFENHLLDLIEVIHELQGMQFDRAAAVRTLAAIAAENQGAGQ